jgi:hypothetical protein
MAYSWDNRVSFVVKYLYGGYPTPLPRSLCATLSVFFSCRFRVRNRLVTLHKSRHISKPHALFLNRNRPKSYYCNSCYYSSRETLNSRTINKTLLNLLFLFCYSGRFIYANKHRLLYVIDESWVLLNRI